jgi:hypothetical protein
MSPAALSYARDIRPLFTDMDVAHMKREGIDLSNYHDVKANADDIYTQVSSGRMPPKSSGEAAWTTAQCDTFKAWQDQGCPP